jgi:hypothetical protein
LPVNVGPVQLDQLGGLDPAHARQDAIHPSRNPPQSCRASGFRWATR